MQVFKSISKHIKFLFLGILLGSIPLLTSLVFIYINWLKTIVERIVSN